MAQPSVSAIPSFGTLLTQEEKAQDQTIDVVTTNIENTQFVTITFDDNVFVEQMANNSAVIAVASTYLTPLIDAEEYSITASVSNIYGDVAIGPTTAFQFTVMPAVGSTSTTDGAIEIRDEGVSVGFVTALDFVGGNITATAANDIATINVIGEGGVGGGGTIYVRDENIPLGIVTTFNFTGLGVTATVTGQTAVVSVAGTIDGGSFTD